MTYSVRDIQKKLSDLGFDPGPIDGIYGRQTAKAIRGFQKTKRVRQTGAITPALTKALFGDRETQPSLPWMQEAYRRRGLHEYRNKRTLWNWLKSDGGSVGDPSKVPWCGDFVETAVALTLPEEMIPENPYLAANWMKYGRFIEPTYGAVMVFWRGSPSSWKGHVGFYMAEDATHYHILGGNQSNAVTVSRIAKNRLRKNGSRWPETYSMPRTGRVLADGSGLKQTTNEA